MRRKAMSAKSARGKTSQMLTPDRFLLPLSLKQKILPPKEKTRFYRRGAIKRYEKASWSNRNAKGVFDAGARGNGADGTGAGFDEGSAVSILVCRR